MIKEIKINNRLIGTGYNSFIIAEMSGNHNQSLDKAFAIVKAAADAGVDAIKLQTYTADTITFKGSGEEFQIKDENSLWKNQNLYDLYKQAYTPWEWHKPIFDYANELGLIAFSSPFDESAVDFLETLSVPVYKIASFENTDHILLKKVANTGKPVIMSTGVATIADIQESIKVLEANGCKELVLLKCTSTYPASPETTNILTIPHMRDLYNYPIGLSDHTMGIGVSIAAVALGACVIEKHLTLSRAEGGVDAAFSLEPNEFKSLVTEAERAWLGLGTVNYELTEKEKKSLQFKRSLYLVKDIKAGEVITPAHIKSIRPGNGLHTRFYNEVIGKTIKENTNAGTPLSFELFE
jgi:N-acetylneuraminate synthase